MKKFLSIVCLGLGVALGTGSYALEQHYEKQNPTSPDFNSGKVIELNVHGKFVYISNNEVRLKNGASVGALVFMLLGGWLWASEKSPHIAPPKI